MGAVGTDVGVCAQTETTVLIVDDYQPVLEAYACVLRTRYTVRAANEGERALEMIDDSVDVVFLDRRMPGMSGDTVLDKLRERGYDVPVAMLTAVDPAADIVDMPFDEYLFKPVSTEVLLSTVAVLTSRAAFDDTSREFHRLVSKKAALETEGINQHAGSYDQITERLEKIKTEVDTPRDKSFETYPESVSNGI